MREIEARLEPLQEALAIDGGALTVVGVDDGVLKLELTLAPDACHECIAPDDLLGSIVLARLDGADLPPIERVEVSRPREASLHPSEG